MCGRYTLTAEANVIADYFGLRHVPYPLAPRYNIAPSQMMPVILIERSELVLQEIRWGLTPSWTQDLAKTKPQVNARSETLATKPFFKTAFAKRRCIIPASGFYEWQETGHGKVPHYIHLKDSSVFGIAGIYEDWTSADGEVLRTCAIITVPANASLSEIHERMPAILTPAQMPLWLDPTNQNLASLKDLLAPYPDSEIEFHRVSTLVNTARSDSPACIAVAV